MSKTVIDELVVAVGLDPKDFLTNAKQVEQTITETKTHINSMGEAITVVNKSVFKAAKETQESNKKTGESFDSVTQGIYKLTAAYLGVSAIKSFVTDVTQADAALGRLSRNLNLAPEDIKGYEGVAEKFGVSAGEMDSAFSHIATIISKRNVFGEFSPELALAMGRAGVSVADFFSKATDDAQRFLMVQAAINKGIKEGRFDRAGAVELGSRMGFDPKVVTMMIETEGRLQKLVAEYKEKNLVNEQDTENAQALAEAWVDAKANAEGFGRSIYEFVSPALVSVLDLFSGKSDRIFASWGDNIAKWLKSLNGVSEEAVVPTPRAPDTRTPSEQRQAAQKIADDYMAKHGGHPPEHTSTTSPTSSVADRNHNPGNLRPANGVGFRTFKTDEGGIAAADRNLQNYGTLGRDTIEKIITHWSPPSDNKDRSGTLASGVANTQSYINAVAKGTGFDPKQKLNMADPAVRLALERSMFKHEGYTGRMAQAQRNSANGGRNVAQGDTISHETNIRHVTVIAKDDKAVLQLGDTTLQQIALSNFNSGG